MMLTLRKNNDDVFYSQSRTPPKKRAQSEKEKKKKQKREQSGDSLQALQQERWKRGSRKLSEALRSPKEMLLRRKKPLGPSLSWEPEHLGTANSSDARSRIHSDGSDGSEGERLPKCDIEEPRFELEVRFYLLTRGNLSEALTSIICGVFTSILSLCRTILFRAKNREFSPFFVEAIGFAQGVHYAK